MRKKILYLAIIILIISGFLQASPFVFGQSNSIDAEIEILNQQIINQKKQIEALQTKQKEYAEQIKTKQNDKINLNNQLAILDDRLSKAQLDIDSANLEINKTSLEIKKVEADSTKIDTEIEKRKEHLASLLRLVYKQDQVTTLEMLLLNDSLADFLNQAKNLEDTNKEISASVADLRLDKERLEKNQLTLNDKNNELITLRNKLEEKKDSLAYEQANKIYILEETKASERSYQQLLAKAQREQNQAMVDIASAEILIRKKLSEKDRQKLNDGNNTISWPVTKNVITSIFHDPDYPYRRLIGEHSGVDIRAKQGSPLMAAADGYVAKVKFDGSKAYAYIMIIHGDGLATVYGHVSAVYVKTDQYVNQGEVIGRTGGMPGGIGSGSFSTGPHLHFEVRKDGLPVDPQKYLP
jgi:murein DD-endopeptidase MepM/ murein hydrolase activator NlpD